MVTVAMEMAEQSWRGEGGDGGHGDGKAKLEG